MGWLGALVAVGLMVLVFIDAFETMILPRRVRHGFRLARIFYRSAWIIWRAAARIIQPGRWRQAFLSIFGPLSLFALFFVWAWGLMISFALLHWSLKTEITGADGSFLSDLYFSGTTFFTLGYGDRVPIRPLGRALSVVEAGLGLVFLAVVISYLPVLYQAFSRREITISLLDARAGSPPTAGELLRRLAEAKSLASAGSMLVEWERWAAELLENHISFPVLSYYRSQHENQSWVAALTTILDTSALFIAGVEGPYSYQARLTFAMARHAAVDLTLVFRTPQPRRQECRLSDADFARLWQRLREARLELREAPAAEKPLAQLRALYEPFVVALSGHFLFAVPPFLTEKPTVDNWQTSPWMPRSPDLGGLPAARSADDHFD